MAKQEDILSGMPGFEKSRAEKIAKAAIRSPEKLDQLLDAMLAGPNRICQQAAWCLSLVAQKERARLEPFLPQLMNVVADHGTQTAGVLRNTLRILKLLDIPPEFEEKLIYHCFDLVADVHQPIAIRAFSLYLLGRASVRVPEIQGELRDLIDYHFDNESAAFQSTSKQVLKMINNKKNQ